MAHSHNHGHPDVSGRKLVWTMLLNVGITAAEFIAGILTGYLALLADAVHNLSDVAALALAWLGYKGSQLPPTTRSTYGFKRVEVMTAFVSAVALVVIAVYILFEAYDRLVNPQDLTHPWVFLTVAAIGLLGNVASIWVLLSEKGKSLNMKTAFLHMVYDALSSVAVLIGGVVILLTGWVILDAFLSMAIALMIFWSSWLVIKEALLVFLEAAPPSIRVDEVQEAIAALPDVRNVHHLHVWSLSSRDTALSCHICVSEARYSQGPEIIAAVNRLVSSRFHIGHATIQLEKGDCADPHLTLNPDHDHRNSH